MNLSLRDEVRGLVVKVSELRAENEHLRQTAIKYHHDGEASKRRCERAESKLVGLLGLSAFLAASLVLGAFLTVYGG